MSTSPKVMIHVCCDASKKHIIVTHASNSGKQLGQATHTTNTKQYNPHLRNTSARTVSVRVVVVGQGHGQFFGNENQFPTDGQGNEQGDVRPDGGQRVSFGQDLRDRDKPHPPLNTQHFRKIMA